MADRIKLTEKQFSSLKGMREAQDIIAGRIQSYVMGVLDGVETPEGQGYDIDWKTGEIFPVDKPLPEPATKGPELVS